MKLLVFAVLLVSVTFQTSSSAQPRAGRQTRVVYGPATEILAYDIRHDAAARTTYARGQVRIATAEAVITADEADLLHLRDTRRAVDLSITLRGDVRVTLTPAR